MRRTSTRRGAFLPSLSLGRRAFWLALLAPSAPAVGQDINSQDEIDFSGRTSLTLGSGARAFGMGGAFLARADDATAASWNPAGLSYLRYPELSLAGNHTLYRSERIGAEPERNRFDGDAADFAAFTWPVRLRGASGAVQVSFQRAVPHGGSRHVEQGLPDGRTIVSTGEAKGGFDVIAFGSGWRFTRALRAGVTINRWFNGYEQTLERNVPEVERERRVFDADFAFRGWNSNLGVIWSPLEQVNVAGVFKTPFTAEMRLDKKRMDFFQDSSGNEVAVTENFYLSEDVRVDFPAALGFGVSWRPRSALTLSADLTRTFWSKAEIRNFFTLPVTPRTQAGEPPNRPAPDFYDSLPYPFVDKTQGDGDQIRFGVEYVVFAGSLKVPLRAGYFSDQQIVRPAAGGSAPRYNSYTAGVGIILGPLLLDVAYLYESGESVEAGEESAAATQSVGVRNTLRTERFFVSLIYRLGGPR